MYKGTSNVRTFGIAAKLGTGDLQIEQREATVSPNPELASENLDSDADPNYSLSDNSCQPVLISTVLHCKRSRFVH